MNGISPTISADQKNREIQKLTIQAASLFGALFLVTVVITYFVDFPDSVNGLVRDIVPSFVSACFLYVASAMFFRRQEEIFKAEELDRLADQIAQRLVTSQGSQLDPVILDQGSVEDVLSSVRSEIWVAQETGEKLFQRHQDAFRSLMKDGRMRLILVEKDSLGASQAAFRSRSKDGWAEYRSKHNAAENALREIYDWSTLPQRRVEVRYSAFALPLSMLIANPLDGQNTRSVCRVNGNGRDSDKPIAFAASGKVSREVVSNLEQDFLNGFYCSSKVVLFKDSKQYLATIATFFPKLFKATAKYTKENVPEDTTAWELSDQDRSRIFTARIVVRVKSDLAAEVRAVFGTASGGLSEEVVYVQANGEWSVQTDGFVRFLQALCGAQRDGQAIFLGGINDICLGARDVLSKQAEDWSFVEVRKEPWAKDFLRHYQNERGEVLYTIDKALHDIMECTSSHVFIHFEPSVMAEDIHIYKYVLDNVRTSHLLEADVSKRLHAELKGSARALAFTRAAGGAARDGPPPAPLPAAA